MDKVKIAFFDSKPYDKEFFDKIKQAYKYEIVYFDSHLNENTTTLTKGFNTVCLFVNDILTEPIINEISDYGVKLIALRSAGYNNVDLKAAYGRIHVVRVPEYSPYAVAEHAVALILSLNRKTHRAYFRTRDNNFSINGFLGFDMYGKVAGVVGTGKIGKALINILRGFGMDVVAYDKRPDDSFAAQSGCKYVDMDTLYSVSDIISLNCPLTAETHHMINEESIKKMRDGVMIINTGRGKLIDTQSLIDALKDGKVGSAGLDVYEEESEYFFEDFSSSIIDDDTLARLLTFTNVLVTSHQGFFTREALSNISTTTLNNIKEYYDGNALTNEICYRCDENGCPKTQTGRCF